MYIPELDEKDNQIINMLISDARLTYSEIGEEVGLTRVAVKNRVKALEEKGYIRGYHADVTDVELPNAIPCVVKFVIEAQSLFEVIEKLKNEQRVVSLYQMAAGDTLYGIVYAKDLRDLKNFIESLIEENPGLKGYQGSCIMDILKGSVLPL